MSVAALSLTLALAVAAPSLTTTDPTIAEAERDASAPPLFAWGCHGPASMGLLTGATIGGVIAGGIGGYGTWTVNAGADDETRGALTFASTAISAGLGVLIGGGIGAGIGLIAELVLPDAPVRRVIRVTDGAGTEPDERRVAAGF